METIFFEDRTTNSLPSGQFRESDGAVNIVGPGTSEGNKPFEPHCVKYQIGHYVVTNVPRHTEWVSAIKPNEPVPATWYLLKKIEGGFNVVGTTQPGRQWRDAVANFVCMAEALDKRANASLADLIDTLDLKGDVVLRSTCDDTYAGEDFTDGPAAIKDRTFLAQFGVRMVVPCSGEESEDEMYSLIAARAKKMVWRNQADCYITPQFVFEDVPHTFLVGTADDSVSEVTPEHGWVAATPGLWDGIVPSYQGNFSSALLTDIHELTFNTLRGAAYRLSAAGQKELPPVTADVVSNLCFNIYPLFLEFAAPIPWQDLYEDAHNYTLQNLLEDERDDSAKKKDALSVRYADNARKSMLGIDIEDSEWVSEADLQHAHNVWQQAVDALQAFKDDVA